MFCVECGKEFQQITEFCPNCGKRCLQQNSNKKMNSSNIASIFDDDQTRMPMIVYLLYLAGLVFGGVGSLAGVIMAYVYRKDAPEWLQSHYCNMVRVFWISLLYAVVGGLLSLILIGIPILLFGLVWFIVRCAKGIKYLNMRESYPRPESWGF